MSAFCTTQKRAPPGSSSTMKCLQHDTSRDIAVLPNRPIAQLRLAGPRCRGRDEANSGCGDADRDPGTRDWDLVLWVTENHPAVFRRLARHVMKRRLPKGNRAVEVVAMNDDGPDLHSPLR